MRTLIAVSLVITLTGCAPVFLQSAKFEHQGAACEKRGNENCFYINSPIRLGKQEISLPGRAYPFRRAQEALSFVDSGEKKWSVPPETLTDGASIPPVFLRMLGSPTEDYFINASALHDAYCGIGNEEGPLYQSEPWQAVHRMFYEALRVSAVPEVQAKTMYAAVLFGGPRWGPGAAPRSGRASSDESDVFPGRPDLKGIPLSKLTALFDEIRAFILANNPSVEELEAFIAEKDSGLKSYAAMFAAVTKDNPDDDGRDRTPVIVEPEEEEPDQEEPSDGETADSGTETEDDTVTGGEDPVDESSEPSGDGGQSDGDVNGDDVTESDETDGSGYDGSTCSTGDGSADCQDSAVDGGDKEKTNNGKKKGHHRKANLELVGEVATN